MAGTRQTGPEGARCFHREGACGPSQAPLSSFPRSSPWPHRETGQVKLPAPVNRCPLVVAHVSWAASCIRALDGHKSYRPGAQVGGRRGGKSSVQMRARPAPATMGRNGLNGLFLLLPRAFCPALVLPNLQPHPHPLGPPSATCSPPCVPPNHSPPSPLLPCLLTPSRLSPAGT